VTQNNQRLRESMQNQNMNRPGGMNQAMMQRMNGAMNGNMQGKMYAGTHTTPEEERH